MGLRSTLLFWLRLTRPSGTPTFTGLRSADYPDPDLAAATKWYAETLGFEPRFDEPFQVGFCVAQVIEPFGNRIEFMLNPYFTP